MVNDCNWHCEDCGEEFCGHCYKGKITDDQVVLCDECYDNLKPTKESEVNAEGGSSCSENRSEE